MADDYYDEELYESEYDEEQQEAERKLQQARAENKLAQKNRKKLQGIQDWQINDVLKLISSNEFTRDQIRGTLQAYNGDIKAAANQLMFKMEQAKAKKILQESEQRVREEMEEEARRQDQIMKIQDNIDLIEQILQTNCWLGGQYPCEDDRLQFEQLAQEPNAEAYPRTLSWFLLVQKFDPKVREQWKGSAVISLIKTPLFLEQDKPYASDQTENEIFELKTSNPDDYVEQLSLHNRHQERRKFCYDSMSHFSIYISDYLEPLYAYQRRIKQLCRGQKTLIIEKVIDPENKSKTQISSTQWHYSGELNEQGQAHGIGIAKMGDQEYRGCFFQDDWEGLGCWKDTKGRLNIGEYRTGSWHGRLTVYYLQVIMLDKLGYRDGRVLNQTFEQGDKRTNSNVTECQDQVFYTKEVIRIRLNL